VKPKVMDMVRVARKKGLLRVDEDFTTLGKLA
jgi:hypothetical protein